MDASSTFDADDPPFVVEVSPAPNTIVGYRVTENGTTIKEGTANRSSSRVNLTEPGKYTVVVVHQNQTMPTTNTTVSFAELAGCNRDMLTLHEDVETGRWDVRELRTQVKCGDPSDIVERDSAPK